MAADDIRHGAYLCVSRPRGGAATCAAAPVDALAARLGLQNEFFTRDGHPRDAVAFLGRVDVTSGDLPDERLASAACVVHVASNDAETVSTFCAGLERLLSAIAPVQILSGTVQPTRYTGGAMHDFAYARQLTQRPGDELPHVFLLPLRKVPEWWEKDWMERHTYFLPRYDAHGRMLSEGHALAASAGIPALMRRTYRCGDRPSPEDGYDFLTYFECADPDVATFHEVCAALRDVGRNPEWRFVREGPIWRGRRTTSWSALWTASGNDPTS